MKLETIYLLTIHFNVDDTKILESRTIKRVTGDAFVSTQYLKGDMKEYPNQNHFLTEELSTNNHVNLEKRLTLDEFKKVMQPTFNLFEDLFTLITKKDNPVLQELVR